MTHIHGHIGFIPGAVKPGSGAVEVTFPDVMDVNVLNECLAVEVKNQIDVNFQSLFDWLNENDLNVNFQSLFDWLNENEINVNFDDLTTWLNENDLNVDFDDLTTWLDENQIDVNIVNEDPIPVSFDPLITQYCLDGSYDDQEAIIRFWSDGKIEYCLLSGGTWQIPQDLKLLSCERIVPVETKKLYFEKVRLSGDLTNAATSWIPFMPGSTAQIGTPGNTFKLTGEYKSFIIRWNRETEEGGILHVDIDGNNNGYGYVAGNGCLYLQDLFGVDSDNGEMFCQDLCFEAVGKAFLEILIIRCK